jgi:hypothetical protein
VDKELKVVEIVFTEEYGEAQGAFLDGELIDYWYCNDACWREDAFNSLCETFGFTTIDSRDEELEKKLIRILRRVS